MDYVQPVEAIIPDAQGRILGVLTRTSTEVNLRTVAELAGLSATHTSRVLPRLVALGVVERRDIGNTSLFQLVDENLVSRWLRSLSTIRDELINEIAQSAPALGEGLLNVTLFGSLARGEADEESDIDLLLVWRRDITDAQEEAIQHWVQDLARVAGNPVNTIGVDAGELSDRLNSRSTFWTTIRRDGICVVGTPIGQLAPAPRSA